MLARPSGESCDGSCARAQPQRHNICLKFSSELNHNGGTTQQNTFIAQTKGKEGDGLLVFEGNTMYEYAIDCDDFSLAEQQQYGLVKKDDDCSVTSAQGPAACYLAQLQKGSKPSGAYVLR
jgi:hypothetical protein